MTLAAVGLALVALLSGCSPDPFEGATEKDEPVDTIWAGQTRQVVSADLTGGFYYDDVFRAPERGDFGYLRDDWRLVAGWRVVGSEGGRLDSLPVLGLAQFSRVERRWMSGLVEVLEAPPGIPGMMLTVKLPSGGGAVRLEFDIRPLDREEAPAYQAYLEPNQPILCIARADTQGGWMAVHYGKLRWVSGGQDYHVYHRWGELTGGVGASRVHVFGDFQARRGGTWSLAWGWGRTRPEAAQAAQSIAAAPHRWMRKREQWSQQVLASVVFDCAESRVVRAYDWARLVLTGMVYPRGGEWWCATGIPTELAPKTWHMLLSVPGAALVGKDWEYAGAWVATVLRRQNADTASACFGMLPSRMYPDSSQFRVPLMSALALQAIQALEEAKVELDSAALDTLAAAAGADLLGTVQRRMRDGLPVSGKGEHLLFDSPAAPSRAGSTIETVALFSILWRWVANRSRAGRAVPGLPGVLLERSGGESLGMLTADGRRGLAGAVSLLRRRESYVVDAYGALEMPLGSVTALSLFNLSLSRVPRFADLQPWSVDSAGIGAWAEPDTTCRVAQALAAYWLFHGDRYRLEGMLEQWLKAGLVAPAGLRSLSPDAPDYEPSHLYRLDEAPQGTTSQGDVLLWTCGVLGDIYATLGRWGDYRALLDTLTDRLLEVGVVGGLSEAESSDPAPGEVFTPGAAVHLTPHAEYVRLMVRGVFGLQPIRGDLVVIRPHLPAEWGACRIGLRVGEGRLWVVRAGEFKWQLFQRGVEPELQVVLEYEYAPGRFARQQVGLSPGEVVQVTYSQSEGGVYRSSVEVQ